MRRLFFPICIFFVVFPLFGNTLSKNDFKFLPAVSATLVPPSYLNSFYVTNISTSTCLEVSYLDKFISETVFPINTGFFSKVKFDNDEDKAMYFAFGNPQISLSYILKKNDIIHTLLLVGTIPIDVNDYANNFVSNDAFFRLQIGYIFRILSDPVSFDLGCTLSYGMPYTEDNVTYIDPLNVNIPFHFIFAYNNKIATNIGGALSVSLPSIADDEWTSSYISYSFPMIAKVIFSSGKNYYSIGIAKDVISLIPTMEIEFFWGIEI